MKLTNLIWVLALAAAVAACNTGPPITGIPPATGGTGGSGTGGTGGSGTGGTGGMATGACTNDADQAVYDSLTYTDEAGATTTGSDAAGAIGSDCIFGAPDASIPLDGCGTEASAVIACFATGCPQDTIDALANCVTACTQDATGLSSECVACTGDTVACGAAFCTTQCVADTNAPQCIQCRCDNDCIPAFDSCSGLPPTPPAVCD